MASRSLTLTVTKTPAGDLALTNFAYWSPSDHYNFDSGAEHFLASVADCFILSLLPHDDIQPGYIALNETQRGDAGVSIGDTVSASRFSPPDNFNLVLLSLKLKFAIRGTESVQLDAVRLADHLRDEFHSQVLTVGQSVAFEYHENKYIFTVTEAVVEGHEISSSNPGRGIVSANTRIVSVALEASEIKIDGVDSPNNVLPAAITNTPSRLGQSEVQAEISLPDENGHLQLFQNHTNMMKKNSFLSPDVNLQELAARTKNCIGAEIESIVRSAASFAFMRQLSPANLTKPIVEEGIRVTMEDFLKALHEITPAFGVSTDLEACRLNGFVDCGDQHELIYLGAMQLVEQVKISPLVTCLLEGPTGSGKTAMAATVGINSNFPFVKIVLAESMIGLHESTKRTQITKIFEDAYKSPLSIVILDDIERLLEYVDIGPCFSKLLLETLMVLLKQVPPKGKKLLVMGTTSKLSSLDSVGIRGAFSVTYHVPTLKTEDSKKVLQQLNAFAEEDIDAAAEALNDMPIKKLYTAVEMAARSRKDGASGDEKIDMDSFHACLQDMTLY